MGGKYTWKIRYKGGGVVEGATFSKSAVYDKINVIPIT